MHLLKIGHYTNVELGTGLSVFLFDKPVVAAYHLCGSSPATRELHTLEFESNTTYIDALLFSGGSAFGLGAADGVMRFLQEHGRGKQVPHGVVPIVPTVAIYDLAVKAPVPPTAEDAYQACVSASEQYQQGRIGVGTGATVGKLAPNSSRMSGGLGWAEIILENGLQVLAYAAVNCVGDVRDSSGKIIAGARVDNKFADCQALFLKGIIEKQATASHTTLVAIFTNAAFSKVELKRITKMALCGMARAIYPVFTRYDGDIIFAASLGEHVASEVMVATIATEVVQQAIVNAVQDSEIMQKD
jgi:L-aminopeptidase/D-esterase-like protein